MGLKWSLEECQLWCNMLLSSDPVWQHIADVPTNNALTPGAIYPRAFIQAGRGGWFRVGVLWMEAIWAIDTQWYTCYVLWEVVQQLVLVFAATEAQGFGTSLAVPDLSGKTGHTRDGTFTIRKTCHIVTSFIYSFLVVHNGTIHSEIQLCVYMCSSISFVKDIFQ